jgi:multimeric flavodoxin WrbA
MNPTGNPKKVTAFVGCASRKHTYREVEQFLAKLAALGEIESEIVVLSNYRLEPCRGCKVCFMRGEEFCPLKDDRDVLFEKIMASDGVIFATPNYSFQVSGILKVFLDRLGFVFHRPRYFGKTFTAIVSQGFYGGNAILKYLDFVANGLGFHTVKGSCITALDPMTEKEQARADRAVEQHARRFYARLTAPAYPAPTFLKLMMFRMGRSNVRLLSDQQDRDYVYYTDRGWLDSAYFYPGRLPVLKRVAGSLFDALFTRMARASR